MAIKDNAYGENQQIGFSTVLTRNAEGRATNYLKPDEIKEGEYYMEIVGIDLWEDDKGDDYLKVQLFREGKYTESFGKIGRRTMWKLERSIRGIFGKLLPFDEVQSEGGRMPPATRKAALGRFVKVSIKDSDYDGQDVLIVGDTPYKAPEGVKPMFEFGSDKPTGNWPLTAEELRGGEKPAPSEDW